MDNDRLRLFNTKLVEPIASMNDDELWAFLLENEERIKLLQYPDGYPASGFLNAYAHGGIEWLKKHFLKHIEDYREGVIFTLVIDFCFADEKIVLDYWARSGFLDGEDSCGVKTSDDVMPPVDEDSEEWCRKDYFHLLEPHHVANIIQAMEKNFDKLIRNTRGDIIKIKAMREFCLKNDGYKVAYIYDI